MIVFRMEVLRVLIFGMRLWNLMIMTLFLIVSFILLSKFFLIYAFFVWSGDTFTDGSVKYTMTSMNVPEPVMSLAVQPVSKDSGGQVSGFVYVCLCACVFVGSQCCMTIFFFFFGDSFQRLWIVSRERILLSELGWMLRVGRSEL